MDRNFGIVKPSYRTILSLSARRAWIEINVLQCNTVIDGSLSARRAWIEMFLGLVRNWFTVSLSARRAWIEIFVPFDVVRPAIVALRKESVDRNARLWACLCLIPVALRKESVDRNASLFCGCSGRCRVALRKESVDRNVNLRVVDGSKSSSLSARRAWIEMSVML